MISPKSIGLINREDIIELLKRSRLIFKLSRIVAISLSFSGIGLTALTLILNSSSLVLILVEIFQITFYTFNSYFTMNLNLSQMTYFYIICHYFKLKLRNANNSIRKCFEKKYKMTNYKIKNILKSFDSIISEIITYNNDFQSKCLIIVLMLIIIVLNLIFF